MSGTLDTGVRQGRGIEVVATGVVYYYVTTLLVVIGVTMCGQFVEPLSGPQYVTTRMTSGTGQSYRGIVERGYSYSTNEASAVAFFPAYPLLSRVVAQLAGTSTEVALLVVANLCASAAFVIFAVYARQRLPPSTARHRMTDLTLLAFGLLPTTMFFRMGYSESLFLLVAIGAMYLMQRQAHPLWVALVVGLGTATRPVGVALLGPFALYLCERGREGEILRCAQNDSNAQSDSNAQNDSRFARLLPFLRSAVVWLPLACWGIGGYMLFQYLAFGDPLAFFHTQQYFAQRPPTPYLEQWGRALILEPIWSVYDSSSIAYWARPEDAPKNPLLSLSFANPIYFVVSVFLVWLGWRKRWLDGKEVLLAALLLGIPYLTHSYRYLMLSQGRFAAVAFPVYIVMGRLMARMPAWLVAVLCALSGFLLAVYAALFAAGYRVT